VSFATNRISQAHPLSRIHIEQRPPIEATQVRGRNIETGDIVAVRITPEGVGEGKEQWQQVYNPSFDVTPAELISGFIAVCL
jgi:methylthioribose-1-phosphate isomerase